MLDETGQPVKPAHVHHHATPHEKGSAVDMYFDGLSYRQTADNIGQYFGRETSHSSVYKWVRELTGRAEAETAAVRIPTGKTWVADEMRVKVGGQEYWLFNVMDSDSRFVLAAYLSPERSAAAAETALGLARRRAADAPEEVKTDSLEAYVEAMPQVFGSEVKHVVSEGAKSEINNNMSERLQGTFRDRNKTLRGLKSRESGQEYLDGLVMHYNYFRPHDGLDGKRPAEAAGADLPFCDWRDVAAMDTDEDADAAGVAAGDAGEQGAAASGSRPPSPAAPAAAAAEPPSPPQATAGSDAGSDGEGGVPDASDASGSGAEAAPSPQDTESGVAPQRPVPGHHWRADMPDAEYSLRRRLHKDLLNTDPLSVTANLRGHRVYALYAADAAVETGSREDLLSAIDAIDAASAIDDWLVGRGAEIRPHEHNRAYLREHRAVLAGRLRAMGYDVPDESGEDVDRRAESAAANARVKAKRTATEDFRSDARRRAMAAAEAGQVTDSYTVAENDLEVARKVWALRELDVPARQYLDSVD